RRVLVQEDRIRQPDRARAALGRREPLQPREPGPARPGARRSRQRQSERGPHQRDRELQPGLAAEPAVRGSAELLSTAATRPKLMAHPLPGTPRPCPRRRAERPPRTARALRRSASTWLGSRVVG